MAHLKHAKTVWQASNYNRPEHKSFKAKPTEIRANKIIRNLERQVKSWKIGVTPEGVVIPAEELVKESMITAPAEMAAKKASYEFAKKEGKLWTKEQKAASKAAKARERRLKRLSPVGA